MGERVGDQILGTILEWNPILPLRGWETSETFRPSSRIPRPFGTLSLLLLSAFGKHWNDNEEERKERKFLRKEREKLYGSRGCITSRPSGDKRLWGQSSLRESPWSLTG